MKLYVPQDKNKAQLAAIGILEWWENKYFSLLVQSRSWKTRGKIHALSQEKISDYKLE